MAGLDALKEVHKVPYPFLTNFEKSFDPLPWKEWMERYWTSSIVIGVFYLFFIFSVKDYMNKRQAFDLRIALGIWSSILAIFSILGTLRSVHELFYTFTNYGLQFTVCNPTFYTGASGFWAMLYTFSKVYELGDTVFIVLRKQKLIFLHWYHHLATLIYMFFTYKDLIAVGRWGMALNYTVHSFMYTYYALKAFRISVPKIISIIITSIQILQMVAGVTLNSFTMLLVVDGVPCQQTLANNIVSFLMYASYLILFSNFFYKNYLGKAKRL